MRFENMKKNSFIRGISSVLNIFPSEREEVIEIPTHTDAEAIKKDLEQVGNDMFFVLNSLPLEEKEKIHKS
jgi:hypothetical protein